MLEHLYWEAGWLGVVAARALIESIRTPSPTALRPMPVPDGGTVFTGEAPELGTIVIPEMDWGSWLPGRPDAAERLLGPDGSGSGLQTLLTESDVMIRSIEDTRLEMLGRTLAEAVDQGLGVSETAQMIEWLLTNPERAEMIAHTEMTRAVNAATMDQLRSEGVNLVEWQTADDNACPVCQEYEANNPYLLDEAPQPPEHPWCGCVLLPVSFDGDVGEQEIELAVGPDLVKVRRQAIDRALRELAKIPAAKGNKIDVPWPIQTRPVIPTDDWAKSELRLFDIEELYATQKYLKRDVVEWHLNHLGNVGAGQNSNPNVVVEDGVGKIYDGHHRLAALWLLGVVTSNCWTLEV